jgi:threonine/homoserine/homoserine lactone efflux protein
MSFAVIFFTAWMVGFSGAMAPGPISTLVVTQASRRGFWVGPLLTLGHAIAEATVVSGLALGLRELLATSRLTMAIALVGGPVLVWMGATTLRDALRQPALVPQVAAVDRRQSRWGPVGAGIAASVSNPYWLVWWSTVGASYIVLSLQRGVPGLAAFYSGHILSDLSWNSLLAFLMASGRRWLPAGAMRGFLIVAGLFLIGLGIYFALTGLHAFAG